MRLSLGLIALAACSPVVAHTPDGHTVDSPPDAPSHGMVTVKVFDQSNSGAVVVGVPVVFVEADGTQAGAPVTGTDGTASADVHAGASVTVVVTSANGTSLQTVLGAKPGDTIVIGPSTPASTSVGTFSVSFPTYSGATNYNVFGPCGSVNGTTSPLTLTLYSNCKLDTMDITVVPRDANSNDLAFLTKTGVAFTASGTTSVTGAYSNLLAFTATLTNVGANVTGANIYRYVPDQEGYYKSASGTPTNGTLSVMTSGPSGAKALITTSLNTATSSQEVFQSIAGNVQTYGLDAPMTLLPWINTPSLDAANHKIVITTDTTGTTNDTPDVAFAQAGYSRTVGTTTQSFNWLIVGATTADLTLPVVPMTVGDVMPKATDTMGGVVGAMLEADTVNGFDDIRLDIYKNINALSNAPHPTAMKIRESLASSGGR
jgi:hypothetical protein